MSASSSGSVLPRSPWDGGRRVMVGAAAAGAVGIGLWLVSMAVGSAQRSGFSWLWAFTYWLTPVLGAVGWHCAFRAAKANWIIVPRRLLELMGGVAPIFVLLFLPVLFSMKSLYPWMHPESYDEEARRLFEHRHVWMNAALFVIRAVVFFGVLITVSELMLRWSTEQDGGDKAANTAKTYKLGPASLPLLGLTFSFCIFDWLMSLNVTMFSSMFGLYLIGGSAMAAMAVWILLTNALGTPINVHHRHSMGKLLFAFNCFWAYTAFCQFMLIWIADIPDETPWHFMRLESDWKYVGYFLVLFHFVLPFIILLSKRLKFSPLRLSVMAVWLLVMHAVDIYWIVLPQLTPEGPSLALSDIGAFVGVGGIVIAFLVFRMRGRLLVPVGDPFLQNSLEYHP